MFLFMYFNIISEVPLKTYTLVNEAKSAIHAVEDKVQLLKAVVVQNVPEEEEEKDDVLQMMLHETEESFENFSNRLEEPGYRNCL